MTTVTQVDLIANVDMIIANNETWGFIFAFGTVDDLSWSLDHKDLYCDVKSDPADEEPLLALSTLNGRLVVTDTVNRIVNFYVTDEDVRHNLLPDSYVYDLIMVDQTTGDTQRLMTGKLKVEEGVTKEPVP